MIATPTSVRRSAVIALAICAACACSATLIPALSAQTARRPSSAPALAASELTWPPPPAPARIRFVRALDPATGRRKPSLFSKIVRAIVGW